METHSAIEPEKRPLISQEQSYSCRPMTTTIYASVKDEMQIQEHFLKIHFFFLPNENKPLFFFLLSFDWFSSSSDSAISEFRTAVSFLLENKFLRNEAKRSDLLRANFAPDGNVFGLSNWIASPSGE